MTEQWVGEVLVGEKARDILLAMSSNIPVSFLTDFMRSALTQLCHTAQARRATTVNENENANARPLRISMRTRPLAQASTTTFRRMPYHWQSDLSTTAPQKSTIKI